MEIFAFLILVLFADFAIGDDVHMSLAAKMKGGSHRVITDFADADDFYVGIKACTGASVIFSNSKRANTLAVSIGNLATKTAKLLNGYGTVLVDSGEVVLDCNEMKYFWMNKANGVLTVGRGLQSGTDVILQHSLPGRFIWGEIYFQKMGEGEAEFEKQVKAPFSSPDSVYSINLETTNESDSFQVNNNIVASSNAVIYTQTSQNTSNNQDSEQETTLHLRKQDLK
ncbi:hypothetical protein CAPTEDRAFT_205092 [Capitella teleta]|uniref:Farnesoic acid O-methyl transferase domain-containing protein n=1 Tax=Capitella teleta TaxID=283909 RepID=R7VA51_CAPTE|nr:hypothetical protein CAPTEDRAFT_205092 [Capitella teleta]|eukprot:ELU15678.1 hypothetical protein CAPTEDRAFT_205092 [Capitella teleta]